MRERFAYFAVGGMIPLASQVHAGETLDKLQGTWEIVSGERMGRQFGDGEMAGYDRRILVVKEDKFAWSATLNKRLASGLCGEDKSEGDPRIWFNIRIGETAGDRSLAIVNIEDDKLKICYSDGHRNWPKGFETTGREGYATIVYKRVKSEVKRRDKSEQK